MLLEEGSLLVWGTNAVPFPGGPLLLQVGNWATMTSAGPTRSSRRSRWAREGDSWRRLPGSKPIYVLLEADDSVQLEMPHFCPRCSRLALSLGVAEWIFALPDSLVGYSSADYDAIAQLRW